MTWKLDAIVKTRADLERPDLLEAIKFVAENGNRVTREEIDEVCDPDAVDELIERCVLTTTRFGGKDRVEAQANRRLWKDEAALA